MGAQCLPLDLGNVCILSLVSVCHLCRLIYESWPLGLCPSCGVCGLYTRIVVAVDVLSITRVDGIVMSVWLRSVRTHARMHAHIHRHTERVSGHDHLESERDT